MISLARYARFWWKNMRLYCDFQTVVIFCHFIICHKRRFWKNVEHTNASKTFFKGGNICCFEPRNFRFEFSFEVLFNIFKRLWLCLILRGFCLWSWLEILLRPFHAFIQNIRKLIIFSRFFKECYNRNSMDGTVFEIDQTKKRFNIPLRIRLFFAISNSTTICYAHLVHNKPWRILNSTAEITSHHHFAPQVNRKLHIQLTAVVGIFSWKKKMRIF